MVVQPDPGRRRARWAACLLVTTETTEQVLARAASACCASSRCACSRSAKRRDAAAVGPARRWTARSPTCSSLPCTSPTRPVRPPPLRRRRGHRPAPSASRTSSASGPTALWPLAGDPRRRDLAGDRCIPDAATAWRTERGPRRVFAVPFPQAGRDGVAGDPRDRPRPAETARRAPTAISSSCSLRRSARRSPMPTRASCGSDARRRSRTSTARRTRSSATSATSCGRRSR